MRVPFTAAVALLCVGCATEPAVSGRYPLPSSDIQAIQQLVDSRPDIAKHVRNIRANDPDHASVTSGASLGHPGGTGSAFTVSKRHGKWIIDSPIYKEYTVAE
jgi:hypothetical protein